MRRAAAKSLHYLATAIGFVGGLLIIVAEAIEWRGVKLGRGADPESTTQVNEGDTK